MSGSMKNSLKRRVMARIYLEYTKNVFLSYPDYFMFAIFIASSFMLVSFQHVFMNIPKSDIFSFLNYVKVAVLNTSLVLQILIAGFFVRFSALTAIFLYKNNVLSKIPLITKLMRVRA